MNPTDRISAMETNYRQADQAIQDFARALEHFESAQAKIEILKDYYGSQEWFDHVELDQQNQLPEGLETSVLGEDYPYETLGELRNIAIHMLELATNILK